ncbi:MAG TPA: TldD/PmbA family protein [Candidatus Limnocylindrales bacterium]|nr:TldD/PmbA family protein [Candidatus Limnocylindrales bacterium]
MSDTTMTTDTGAAGGGAAERALDTAERALALARARAADAEVEVTVRQGVDSLTRFATSFIHQNVASEVNHVLIRVALDGRNASTSIDGPADDEGLGRAIDGVLEAARVRPPDPDWPGLAPRTAAPDVDHFDEATAVASPDERAARVRGFVDAAGGLETAGFCSTTTVHLAFANSAGQRLTGRGTAATLDGIARTPTADGSARVTSVRLADLDGAAVGGRAASKARDASDTSDLEPGRYEVVLEPDCVANILSFLLVYGFNGKAVEEGRSFARVGEAQFDRSITLRDDVTDPATLGIGFDIEGTPRRPLDLVRDGVTSGILHTRRTARTAGVDSTGHAVEGGAAWGALGANFDVRAGDRSTDELIAGVERGVLVTDFWYTRILDPRTQVVTGLTRNGVWLIEDGRIGRPVTNLRFTQSFLDALGPDTVRGISRERAIILGGWDSIYLVPTLHLGSWNFTGGAKG